MAKNPDPKYGRYILPFVIAGMVGATWVFVNSIEPATVPSASTSATTRPTGASSETTIPETTTTTLPAEIAQYLLGLDALTAEADLLLQRARDINTAWDNRTVTFQDTADALRELSADTRDFANRVEAAATVPSLEPSHLALTAAAKEMATEAENMVSGILDPDSSAGRIAAFAAYQLANDSLHGALDELKTRAGAAPGESGAPATTQPGSVDTSPDTLPNVND